MKGRLPEPGKALGEIFRSALQAVEPGRLVREHLPSVLENSRREGLGRILAVGFGKASWGMARALEEALGGTLQGGLVITPYGHGGPLERILLREAAHPVPDEAGLRATEELLGMLRGADEETLVVCLISGGGSALLERPLEGLSLQDLQGTTELLLKAGADIQEFNALRKHLSAVKGGRLAQAAWPAHVVSLIISDVLGDRVDVIASGPTAPDESTFGDAWRVLEKYGLLQRVSPAVVSALREGLEGKRPETPKPADRVFGRVENLLIGSNRLALQGAARRALELGYQVQVLTTALRGEAREAARWLARKALQAKARGCRGLCLLSGGETTVTVRGPGLGGRNMELALAFCLQVQGQEGISLLSAGTDGTDGPTPAAGAVVDGLTARRARRLGLEPEVFLQRNDSYNFFKRAGGLFVTGPTGTNVMDIQVILLQ